MSERTGLLIVLGTFVCWSGLCAFAGYKSRDMSADRDAAAYELALQEARAMAVEKARATDHANAQHGASVELQRIEAMREVEFVFQTIERKVIEYVRTAPSADGCGLSDDGLRAWNEANAGTLSAAGSVYPTGSTGALPGSDRAAPERQ